VAVAQGLREGLAVFAHKQSQPEDLVWAVILGGTGTGKSTVFNALCGQAISETGVERPKTCGPLLYVHARWGARVGDAWPFPACPAVRRCIDPENLQAESGLADRLVILEHAQPQLAHLVLADTPDLDSVALENRQMAETLYLFADLVVFVTSQEKYADHVPYRFLRRVEDEGKRFFLLLNKAEPHLTRGEIVQTLREHHLEVTEEGLFVLPYTAQHPASFLSAHGDFQAFAERFWQVVSGAEARRVIGAERERSVSALRHTVEQVLGILGEEQLAARKWLDRLDELLLNGSRELIERERDHVSEETRQALQAEIRRVFARYDVLAKPRRLIGQILLSPLRIFGWHREDTNGGYRVALQRLHQKADLTPIQMAVEHFNRQVLEKLSPPDEGAPLYSRLRDPAVTISSAAIRQRVYEEQDRLAHWLESTFDELARGIPKSTEWGIYSTSILWGVLIVMLETLVGGGISLTEAVLDSALAPFITKGAVELFAYHELQRVARELTARHQQATVAVLRAQRDRYAAVLEELMAPGEVLPALRRLDAQLAEVQGQP
jgi:hypothetical protein